MYQIPLFFYSISHPNLSDSYGKLWVHSSAAKLVWWENHKCQSFKLRKQIIMPNCSYHISKSHFFLLYMTSQTFWLIRYAAGTLKRSQAWLVRTRRKIMSANPSPGCQTGGNLFFFTEREEALKHAKISDRSPLHNVSFGLNLVHQSSSYL